ncbi:hypothetical protein P615_17720 [Brevibacillus laterosporus PE36]|nr:hypothetical protein P615_17720 [Brevibacillus laterosporus PE36]
MSGGDATNCLFDLIFPWQVQHDLDQPALARTDKERVFSLHSATSDRTRFFCKKIVSTLVFRHVIKAFFADF